MFLPACTDADGTILQRGEGMPASIIPSFLYYCFITGITPGPANLCSLNASMRYGRRRALLQWRGLFTGYWIVSIASVLITYFLGGVLGNSVSVLAWIGAGYLIWMGIRSLLPKRHDADGEEQEEGQSCNFLTGLIVQLTNVKIMLSCLTALSGYVLPYTQSFGSLLLVGIFLPFTGPVCNLAWLFTGAALQKFFRKYEKIINIVMAVSLFYCAFSLIQAVFTR